jgi:hypothetical protein
MRLLRLQVLGSIPRRLIRRMSLSISLDGRSMIRFSFELVFRTDPTGSFDLPA